MVLARILAPEAFGVVATISLVVSFADMFSDAGFQKYIVQHEFADEDDLTHSVTVAFWTNLAVSVALVAMIVTFRSPIAAAVGNPALGNVLAIASLQLLLTSFSSIQIALFRRSLDFRTLFTVRMVGAAVPLVVAVPLALAGMGYWALVISAIAVQLSYAIVSTAYSSWRPRWFYDVGILRSMFSFSVWSLVEAVSIWLTVWVDVLVISWVLDEYHVGLYSTSVTMVNSLLAVITSATAPVLFAALSRLQDDSVRFNAMFLNTQRYVALMVLPLGVGVYLYRDLATKLFLGSRWAEAAVVIGLWSITSAVVIVFSYFCSEVYRAQGRPKVSVVVQLLHLGFLIPVILISAQFGFAVLVAARSLARLQGVLVNAVFMRRIAGISFATTSRNVLPPLLATLLMAALGLGLQRAGTGTAWSVVSILLCAAAYLGIVSLFPSLRSDLLRAIRSASPARGLTESDENNFSPPEAPLRATGDTTPPTRSNR